MVAQLRGKVGKLKEKCKWLGEELGKGGPDERGFKILVAVDLRQVYGWYKYWADINGVQLCWVSLTGSCS